MSETKNKEHNNTGNNNLSTLLTGIAIGAAITYLFTTESGRKIRDELFKEGAKLLENIGDEVEKAKDKAQDESEKLIEGVKEKKAQIEAEIHTTAKQAKKQAQEVAREITSHAEDIPEQVEDLQKKGRRFFFSKKSSTHES